MRPFSLALLSAFIVGSLALAEELNWTWDEDAGGGAPASAAVVGKAPDKTVEEAAPSAENQPQAGAPAEKSSFAWSWEEAEDVSVSKEEPAAKVETPPPEAPDTGAATETAKPAEPQPVPDEIGIEAELKAESAPAAPEVAPPPATQEEAKTAQAESAKSVEAATEKVEPAVAVVAEPAEKKSAAPRLDAAEYEDLVKENLELRGRIADVNSEKESLAKENENLSNQTLELTKKIEEAIEKIKELKKAQAATPVEDGKSAELESKLSAAEAERNKLSADLAATRKKLEETASEAGAEKGTVRPGSDLYKQLEKENAMLKDELSRMSSEKMDVGKFQQEMSRKLESARREVEAANERQRDLKQRLEAARAAEKENKKAAAKMRENMPAMERELVSLKSAVAEKDMTLDASKRDVVELKEEIQKRERRLQKAEKVAEALDKARSDVNRVGNKEKRDMHYNMAVVYAKEGKYQQAEKEYLRALQLDPTDPDIHYNLGILYDNDLRNKTKAALHYKAYLKLNPYAKDADAVKQWLMEIEMGQKRT